MEEPTRRAVSWRAVALAVLAVGLVSLFSRFNDAAAENTHLIGSAFPTLPTALLLALMVLVVGPLSRWGPRRAFSRGELATTVAVTLLACAVPAEGLMRWLPGVLVGPFARATDEPDVADHLDELDLPAWALPSFAAADAATRGSEEVVAGFIGRSYGGTPWAAWATPALGWALLLIPAGLALLCAAAILRRQWAENERLTFPLAGVYLDLIEPPGPGRWLNATLAHRGFWLAAGAVFALHAWRAMNPYLPQEFPLFPLEFDLRATWAGTPLGATHPRFFQEGRVYLTVAAITALIPSRVAFSLWFCFALTQVERVWLDGFGLGLAQQQEHDRTLGALLVYGGLALVVARRHLGTVARQMLRGRRAGEPRGEYVPYPLAGWGLLLGVAGCFAWLVAAGCGVGGATLIVLLVGLALLASAKVVAATGLMYAWVPGHLDRAAEMLRDLGLPRLGGKSAFWANLFNGAFAHDLRTGVPTMATHAMRVADPTPARGPRLAAIAVIVLVGATIASGAASVWTNYRFASSLDRSHVTPIDPFGSMNMGKYLVTSPAMSYERDLPEGHNAPLNAAGGAAATAATGYLWLRFTWWPLHPLGPLMAYSWAVGRCWPGLLVGWAAKIALQRVGGPYLLRRARPVLVGVIVGEAVTAAFWTVVSLALLAAGRDYHPYQVLPG